MKSFQKTHHVQLLMLLYVFAETLTKPTMAQQPTARSIIYEFARNYYDHCLQVHVRTYAFIEQALEFVQVSSDGHLKSWLETCGKGKCNPRINPFFDGLADDAKEKPLDDAETLAGIQADVAEFSAELDMAIGYHRRYRRFLDTGCG